MKKGNQTNSMGQTKKENEANIMGTEGVILQVN